MSTTVWRYWIAAISLKILVSLSFGQTDQPVKSGQDRPTGGAVGLGMGAGLAPGTIIPEITQASRRVAPRIIPQGDRRRVPQDYSTIQGAIDASSDGDTVLVSENTYLENIRYKGKAIVVGSLYLIDGDTTHIEKTIIRGSPTAHADSGSIVYFIDGEDTTSVLCGFTITGGTGTKYYHTPNPAALALAGCVVSPITFVQYDSGTALTIKGFTAAILGGLGSSAGAAAGGLVLGLLESFSVWVLPAAYKDAVAIALMLGVLFVRPSGILGSAEAARLRDF